VEFQRCIALLPLVLASLRREQGEGPALFLEIVKLAARSHLSP